MKVGVRTPSIKKSISARTTGRAKRTLKRATNPFYGKKGMGMIRDPKRAVKNKVYRKTTVSFKGFSGMIAACIYYPLYWSVMLMWYVCKYSFLLIWWAGAMLVNLGIDLVEWFINRKSSDGNAPVIESETTAEK